MTDASSTLPRTASRELAGEEHCPAEVSSPTEHKPQESTKDDEHVSPL